MKFRELNAVLRYRSRGRGALDGTKNKSAAFLRLVTFSEDFEHLCSISTPETLENTTEEKNKRSDKHGVAGARCPSGGGK